MQATEVESLGKTWMGRGDGFVGNNWMKTGDGFEGDEMMGRREIFSTEKGLGWCQKASNFGELTRRPGKGRNLCLL